MYLIRESKNVGMKFEPIVSWKHMLDIKDTNGCKHIFNAIYGN